MRNECLAWDSVTMAMRVGLLNGLNVQDVLKIRNIIIRLYRVNIYEFHRLGYSPKIILAKNKFDRPITHHNLPQNAASHFTNLPYIPYLSASTIFSW